MFCDVEKDMLDFWKEKEIKNVSFIEKIVLIMLTVIWDI